MKTWFQISNFSLPNIKGALQTFPVNKVPVLHSDTHKKHIVSLKANIKELAAMKTSCVRI